MIVLYPSYSFETLSADRTEEEAAEILAAWSAAFHPALLEKANELPRWESASVPPYESINPVTKIPTVCIIPPSCESFLDENWFEHQQSDGAVHIRHLSHRQAIAEKLLEHYGITQHGFDDEFVTDFYALATAYFLVDTLVRKLHYANLIDDSQLAAQIFEAVKSKRQGQHDEAADHLRQAFEAICTSKEYYYPTETYFLDLTLLTAKTFAETFQQLLNSRKQVNLFLPAKLLSVLPAESPELFATLKTALETGNISVIADAGVSAALPENPTLPLLLQPLLHIVERVCGSSAVYREHINVTPTVFGSQRACLNPLLPQLLKLAGYKGVLHFAPRDGWKISDNGHSKMIWQGTDGTKIDALIRYPLNGSAGTDFFALAEQLGNTINSDHCPTAVFAQYPGVVSSPWLDDLRRMNRYVSALGNFVLLERYFDDTPQCGGVRAPGFEEYPETFLRDEEEIDPLSTWNVLEQENVQRMVRSALGTIRTLLDGRESETAQQEEPIKVLITELAAAFITPSEAMNPHITPPPVASPVASMLVFNPFSFPRKVYIDVSDWATLPQVTQTVELVKELKDGDSSKKEILVNVPPMGYSFVKESGMRKQEPEEKEKEKTEKPPSVFNLRNFLPKSSVSSAGSSAESAMIRTQHDEAGKDVKRLVYVLENEFFEVKIDAVTGMLRSLFTPNSRHNRLSQQFGFRFPKGERSKDFRNENDPNRGYAVSVADDIQMELGALSSKLHIQGRLTGLNGETTAAFSQTVTIRRRSRILETELSLNLSQQETQNETQEELLNESSDEMPSSPWDSYYALRSAWNDNTLALSGGFADGVYNVDDYIKRGSKLFAPRFVDLRSIDGLQSLTLFTEGFPFHRRFGERQLDTIIVTKNESVRQFRFGIGVDIRNPVPASLEFLAADEDWRIPVTKNSRNPSAWFFQIEAKNVIALKWEVIPPLTDSTDRPAGLRVFLLETEGRRAHFAFSSFREPKRAAATDFSGKERKEFKADGDDVLLDMHGHELLPLNIWF